MIELYILIGVAVVIAGAIAYAQIMHYKNRVLASENEIMKQNIRAAEIALHQREIIEQAAFNAQRELKQKHRTEQAKIDAGDRSQFDTDTL